MALQRRESYLLTWLASTTVEVARPYSSYFAFKVSAPEGLRAFCTKYPSLRVVSHADFSPILLRNLIYLFPDHWMD